MREITSGLLSLEESAKRLTQTCLERLQMLELDEVQPGVKTLRILTSDRWSFLIGSVSKLALTKVKEEWAKLPAFESEVINTNLTDCSCELLRQIAVVSSFSGTVYPASITSCKPTAQASLSLAVCCILDGG